MSDLFGGVDPSAGAITIKVTQTEGGAGWVIAFEVSELTSKRRHMAVVGPVPAELLADVLDATSWWVHLATLATRGEHRGIPKKWERRTRGRIEGWMRRS